jgi:hypothetical protein
MSNYAIIRTATGRKEQRLYRERFRYLCGDRNTSPRTFPKQQLGRVDAALTRLFGTLPTVSRKP